MPSVSVVMPAYNAEKTLKQTVEAITPGVVDEIILVDDASQDNTVEVARELGLHVVAHPDNRGYGGNQKTCYRTALERGADIIVMIHPDFQYDPRRAGDMVQPIKDGKADAVLGSRFLTHRFYNPHMPIWRNIGNVFLFMMGYHYVCFGHPFTTPYSLPTDPSGYGSHAEYQAGLGGFSLPGASRVWDLTFGMYRGIFVYTPLLLAALVGLIYRVRQKNRFVWLFILGIFVVQMLFSAAMRYWYGGWDFGPRYLVPMIPFVLLGLATEFVLRWKRLLLMLLGISVLINWTGVQYGPSDSIPGVLAMFILSGPTTPLYEFLSHYFKNYTQWDVAISSTGAYVMLSILIFAIWRRPRVIPTGPSVE